MAGPPLRRLVSVLLSTHHAPFFRFPHQLLIKHPRMDIGSVDGRVAAGAPASPLFQQQSMPGRADENFTAGKLRLRMTFEAKVGIVLREQFPVHRAVRVMANRAAFPQRFMLEDKRPRLFAVTLAAAFIPPRHGQPPLRLEDVAAMRIVALRAIHPAFQDRMMLRQIEFRVRLKVTLQTGGRILSRVDDESPSAAPSLEVFAAGSMTGFTTGLARQLCSFEMNARVGACRKPPRDVGMALEARFVADIRSAGDVRRGDYRLANGRTRDREQQGRAAGGQP